MRYYTLSDFRTYLFNLGIISDEIYEFETSFQAFIGLEHNPSRELFTSVMKRGDSICVVLNELDYPKMDNPVSFLDQAIENLKQIKLSLNTDIKLTEFNPNNN